MVRTAQSISHSSHSAELWPRVHVQPLPGASRGRDPHSTETTGTRARAAQASTAAGPPGREVTTPGARAAAGSGIPLRRECVRQAAQVELGVSSVGMVVVSLLHHSPDLGVQFDPLLPPTRRVATGDLLSDLGVEMVLFVLHFGQKRYNVGMLTAHDVVESVMPAFQSIRGPPEPSQRPLILGPLSWRVPRE